MPQLKPVHLFVVIGVVWAGIAAVLLLNRPPQPALFEEVQSREFLLGLYYRGPESCIALTSLDRLDILVVGNSHVHSGIDAEAVARAFPRQRTGVCGLGTFRPERFSDLLEYLDVYALTPRRIILMVDPYFISHPVSDHDGALVRSAFFGNNVRGQTLARWEAARDAGRPLLGDAEWELDARMAHHTAMLNGLDPDIVEQIIAQHTLQHEIYSEGMVARFALIEDLDRDLAGVCDLLAARGIEIDLLGIPAGPYHLIEHDRDIGGVALADAVDYFAQAFPCERQYLNLTLEDWGLDVRYRINRSLDDAFDYEMFSDVDGFEARYAALPNNRARMAAYDTSHLNRIGAARFTERAMEALGER